MNLLFRSQTHSTPAGRSGDLAAYNARVLQLQDQAFNLACDLLGEESLAVEILEEAFLDGFATQIGNRPEFAQEILRRVLQACLKRKTVLPGPNLPEFSQAGLSNHEMVALVLVDRLELSYAEAAEVIGVTPLNIRKTLAEARFILISYNNH